MPSANTLHSYQERTALKPLQGAGPLIAQDVTGGRGWGGERQENAALFKALEGVGKGALGIYNNWLETKVLEGYTQFQSELSAEKNRYFTENQGENALGAAEHFAQFAAQRQAAYLEQYSGRAHNAFGRMSTQATLHFAETGANYARHEKNAWEDSVLKGAIAQHEQAVAENYANGDYIAAQTDALKERLAAMRPGLDNSAVYAQIDRSTVGNRIGAYLASNNVGAAKALFAQQGPLLGGQADEYMARIRRAEDSNILRGNVARQERLRELQDGLQDAEFIASRTGNVDVLRASAKEFRNLGKPIIADKLDRHADMFSANKAALDEANLKPLPDVVRQVNTLDENLNNTTDPHEYRALALQREALAKNYEARAKVFKDDPARAVDIGESYTNLAVQAKDRLDAQQANGLPLAARRVLTNAEAAPLADAWKNGGLDQRRAVAGQLQTYGEFAGQAAKEIGLGFTERLVLEQVRDNPLAAPNLNAVITASVQKPENLPTLEKADSIAREAAEKSSVFRAVSGVALLMPGNASLQSAKRDLQNNFSMQVRVNGGSAEKAAATVDGRFLALDNATNKLFYDPSIVSTQDIEAGLLSARGTPLRDATKDLPYATEFARKEFAYHMSRNGVWTNAPDGQGFVLIDPVSQSHLTDAKGNVFRILPSELVGAAARKRNEDMEKDFASEFEEAKNTKNVTKQALSRTRLQRVNTNPSH